MQGLKFYALTGILIVTAIAAVVWHYSAYLMNPWTRDAQIRADIVQIAPRVSGPVVDLPVRDNQYVATGDILFRIDPRTFQADLDSALANYDQTLNEFEVLSKRVTAAEAGLEQAKSAITQAESEVLAAGSRLKQVGDDLRRNTALLLKQDVSQSAYEQLQRDYEVDLAAKQQTEAALAGARSAYRQAEAQLAEALADRGSLGQNNERIRAAAAAVKNAQLNMEFTTVRASRDGYVTNLNLRVGSQAVANQPQLALIDRDSFWIEAYFRETMIDGIDPGDHALITLMSYSGQPFHGTVESIGWGISTQDGSPGVSLLPNVSPTFQWIRLAQRIPVRIRASELPDRIVMRVGQTASVMIQKGAVEDTPGTPQALQ